MAAPQDSREKLGRQMQLVKNVEKRIGGLLPKDLTRLIAM